jgi:hypothetical protein
VDDGGVHRLRILTGGAVLRVAAGVFYGLGDAPSEGPGMACVGGVLAFMVQ